MYDIVRLALSVIVAVAAGVFLCLRRRKAKNPIKLHWVIAIAVLIVLILTFALDFVPFENCFMGFESAEKAFAYQHNERILSVAEYDDYALVFSTEGNAKGGINHNILIKQDGKWKLDSVLQRKSDIANVGFCFAERLQIPNSDDCFVLVRGGIEGIESGTSDNITDNRNTKFIPVEFPMSEKIYYGLVENMDSEYVLYVDGNRITWEN